MNYAATAKSAAKQIRKAGTAMTLRVTTPGTINPATDEETGAVVTDYACYGVVNRASMGMIQAFDIRFDGGTLIEQNLRAVVMAAHGMTVIPSGGDKLIINGVSWDVLGCTPVAPDGVTNIVFNLGIKRA